ncbi:hypothetical protein, partial [Cupriavidus sp. AcVe19-1a]|uniref:hypothetical protein n=1 Tax=Cupriavidus sp. AcVe19-1a TaxID=2821359 RepID=UPI001AE72820
VTNLIDMLLTRLFDAYLLVLILGGLRDIWRLPPFRLGQRRLQSPQSFEIKQSKTEFLALFEQAV